MSSPNGSNGTINGKQYFQCQVGYAYFVNAEELSGEDEKKEDATQSIDDKPRVKDRVETVDGHQGIVRYANCEFFTWSNI